MEIAMDAKAVVSPSSTVVERIEGAFNLVSPVSTKDAKALKKTFQTYKKPPKDPTKHGTYNGRTSGTGTPEENVAKRDASHDMNETHGPAKLDKSSSNSDAIRGQEQINIENSGGAKSQKGTSGNAINGIGPKNKKKQQYLDAAKKEFPNG